MTEEAAKRECDLIRQIAYDLHVYLGVGYLEKVYNHMCSLRQNKEELLP